MRVKYIVPGEISCPYTERCKDYKKIWYFGQTPSKCFSCGHNENIKSIQKVEKKSFYIPL